MVDAKENNSAHKKKKQQLYVAIALASIAVAIGISRICLPSDVAMRLIG